MSFRFSGAASEAPPGPPGPAGGPGSGGVSFHFEFKYGYCKNLLERRIRR